MRKWGVGQPIIPRWPYPLLATKREEIEPNPGDKRYVRRNAESKIKTSVDEYKSLSQDDKHNAQKTSKPGQDDHGDGHTGQRKPAE